MKKGIPIFLGVMVAALMLTSFLSAVHSEIIIAKNAALVVKSQPVIASDTTISEIEPDKYDSMIKSFYLDDDSGIPESDQSKELADSSATKDEQSLPAVTDTNEPESNTTAALINEMTNHDSAGTLPPGASDEASDDEITATPANEDSSEKNADALPDTKSDETFETEALPEQDVPALLLAAVEDNNNGIEAKSHDMNDNNEVFTIQAASYTDRTSAEVHYNSLIQNMNETDLDNLRIEKVGKYYTIRLGSFKHYVTAMKFLSTMNSRLSSAIVLKAYIKKERIHERIILSGK
jgi:hypothetical protein